MSPHGAMVVLSPITSHRHQRRCDRPRQRWIGRWALVVMAMGLLIGGVGHGSVVAASPCWQPPVEAPVRDPFRAPSCRYCAGNRGIEYATSPGTAVRSVAAGRVSFAGSVAGTTYVVVELASGWRVTYGNVESALHVNDSVVAGMTIGRTAGAFHFGLREGDTYLDPASFLGVTRYRARLIPSDGSPGNAAGPAVTRCG